MRKWAASCLAALCAALLFSAGAYAQAEKEERSVTVAFVDEAGKPLPGLLVSTRLFDPVRQSSGYWMDGDGRNQALRLDETDGDGEYTYQTPFEGTVWVAASNSMFANWVDGAIFGIEGPVMYGSSTPRTRFLEVPVPERDQQRVTVVYPSEGFDLTLHLRDGQGNPAAGAFITIDLNDQLFARKDGAGWRVPESVTSVSGQADENGDYVWENALCGVHTFSATAQEQDLYVKQGLAVGPNDGAGLETTVTLHSLQKAFPREEHTLVFEDHGGERLRNTPYYWTARCVPGGELIRTYGGETDENGEAVFVCGEETLNLWMLGKEVQVPIYSGASKRVRLK